MFANLSSHFVETNSYECEGFASYLQRTLASPFDLNRLSLPDPAIYLKAFPLSCLPIPTDSIQLNQQGVSLWNACGKLRRTQQDPIQAEHLSRGTIRIDYIKLRADK